LQNQASIRVLEKCGFEREGILKNWVVEASTPASDPTICVDDEELQAPMTAIVPIASGSRGVLVGRVTGLI
jgi:hypothetical protein